MKSARLRQRIQQALGTLMKWLVDTELDCGSHVTPEISMHDNTVTVTTLFSLYGGGIWFSQPLKVPR